MPDVKIVHRGLDYIKVEFDTEEFEITGTDTIFIIEYLVKQVKRLKKEAKLK